MSLRAIDISSWDAGIVPHEVDADIVIVKATGGTWYENPFFEQWADDVLASGKLLGIYHYAVESVRWKTAREEAEYFLSHVRKYVGRFVPVLDWESDAMELPQEWALEWMDIVADATKSTPFFYAYASHLNSKDYSKVAAKYPLWMASYLNRYNGAGWVMDPNNSWGFGSWGRMLMYQYTSTGRVRGFDGDLDLSVFYDVPALWRSMCGDGRYVPRVVRVSYAEGMAQVMDHVIDHDAHGYSQPNREGTGGREQLTLTDGTKVAIHTGDYDCSSLVEECAEAMGLIPRDTWMWTGNEDEILTMYGFRRVTFDDLRRGDVLWRDGHTELYLGNGLQGGARRSEHHSVDGATGDQDGYEIARSAYRRGDWTRCYRCVLTREGEGQSLTENEGEEMQMLIHPSNENKVYWYDGIHEPEHVSGPQKEAVEETYRLCHNGAAIPFKEMPQERFDQLKGLMRSVNVTEDQNVQTSIDNVKRALESLSAALRAIQGELDDMRTQQTPAE